VLSLPWDDFVDNAGSSKPLRSYGTHGCPWAPVHRCLAFPFLALIFKVTWNAGGRVGTLSCEIVKTVQSEIGVESCLHLVKVDA